MDDNVVDSLRIEIEGDSGKAIDSIGKLISTLEKIKNVTSGSNKGLNATQKNLNKIAEFVNKIDSGSTSKLRDLAEGLKGLNEIKVSGGIADTLLDIGAAVNSLKDVDFSNFNKLSNGLAAIQNSKISNISNLNEFAASSSSNSTVIKDSSVTSSADSISNLNDELAKNKSLFEEVSNKANSGLTEINDSVCKVTSEFAEMTETVQKSTLEFEKMANAANSGLTEIKDSVRETSDTVKTLKNVATPSAPAPADMSSLNEEISAMREVTKSVQEATEATSRFKQTTESVGTKSCVNVDEFVRARSEIDLLNMKLTESKNKLQELLNSGNTDSSAVANLVSQINGLQSKIAEATQGGKRFRSVLNGIGKTGKAIGGILKKGLGIDAFKNAITKATAKVGELFTMFKKRAMYRAINTIISAITTGFKEGTANVYQYSKALGGTLASSLDSIATSFLYFKNSVGAAVAPLINMVAPAIDYIIDKCVDLLNALNQVFAKLSGASTWTKAVKYPTEYAEAADSATAANKELKKSILGIDEINPLTDNSSSGSGSAGSEMDYSQMFEEVELGEVNNPFKDFFKPFTVAWTNEGQNTINAIKNAFTSVKEFISSVGDSFRSVWSNGTGQQTLETILRIFQNILNCVGNLGTALATAWKANDNGTKILQNIWDIFNDLLGFVEGIYGATADWIASLDLTPLMTAFEGCTAALEPLVDLIGNTLLWCYTDVLLPLASWTVEDAAPASIDLLSAAIDLLSAALEPVADGIQYLWDCLQPAIAWIEDTAIVIIDGLKDTFEECAQAIDDKSDVIDRAFQAVGDAVKAVWAIVQPVFGLLKLIVQVTFSFIAKIIGNKVGVIISVIGGIIEIIGGVIEFIVGICKGDWKTAWEGLTKIAEGVWDGISGILNGIIGFFETVINAIISGLNVLIKGINKIHVDAPDWVEKLTGISGFGFNIPNISEVSLPRLADGGMVNAGTAFIAGEAGAEVVANIGKRTGVMNTDQMRESVEQGVMDANAEQNALLREEIGILRKILDKDTSSSSYGGARSIISDIERKNRRDGKTVIPVGV